MKTKVNNVFFGISYSTANDTTQYVPKVTHECSFHVIMVFCNFYHGLYGE